MLRAEAAGALMLLTRVPAGWLLRGHALPAPGRCVWAYPAVGALVGAAQAGLFAGCRALAMPSPAAAVCAVAAGALLTGGLHEDGLADMADGFGGGRTRERKLAIMRDSRIGSYGVLALVLAAMLRVADLASIGAVTPALLAAGALSRGAMIVPALCLPPARADGLGAGLGRAGGRIAAAGFGLAAAIAFAALTPGAAAVSVLAAAVAALAVTWLARVQLGGFTGDVLGGCAVVAECAVLTALACRP